MPSGFAPFLCCFLVLCPASAAAMAENSHGPAPETEANRSAPSDAEKAERGRLLQEWTAGMTAIIPYCEKLTRAEDQEDCATITYYVLSSGILATPAPPSRAAGQTTLFQFSKAPTPGQFLFYVVPLLERDAGAGGFWNVIIRDESRIAVTFGDASGPERARPVPIVALKSDIAISPVWKGLILLHEGHHALTIAQGLYGDILSEVDREALIEAKAYLLEFPILLTIGGERYRSLLDAEAKRIAAGLRKQSIVTFRPLPEKAQREIAVIFGPAHSETERKIRNSAFLLHATEQAFRQVHPKNDEQYHLLVHAFFRSFLANERTPGTLTHR